MAITIKALRNLLLTGLLLQGQALPTFEVASVKASPPRTGTARYTSLNTDVAMVRYTNITLKNLIAIAYRTSDRLIVSGQGWIDEDPYDVAAKVPPDTPKDRIPAMLEALLVERFKLAVHRETKEQRAYSLVVGKKGAKLKPGQELGSSQTNLLKDGVHGRAMNMGGLADSLSRRVGYPVVDNTGLSGTYEINLRWTPENSKTAGVDIFTAIQEQLGLKLEPSKASVEMLVVDHAERVPTEN